MSDVVALLLIAVLAVLGFLSFSGVFAGLAAGPRQRDLPHQSRRPSRVVTQARQIRYHSGMRWRLLSEGKKVSQRLLGRMTGAGEPPGLRGAQ